MVNAPHHPGSSRSKKLIPGRSVSEEGAVAGSESRVGAGATDDEWKPDVAWNGTGHECLVGRADDRHDLARGGDAYGRLVTG